MADHLILSLQPLNFPCSLHRRWGLSRRIVGGISFSVPEFQLSSQLKLPNCISSSQSSSSSPIPPPNSAPEKFDLLSSTQLNDGSHVFRFGDASEIENILETEKLLKKQHAKIAEEASDVSRKSDAKKKSFNPAFEKDERAAPSSLINVIKIKDRKRVRPLTKKKKETLTSANVSWSEDKAEGKTATVSNLSSIVSVTEAIEEKVVSGKSEENVSTVESYNVELLSSEVMEKDSVNEVGDFEPNGYQQITDNRLEVPLRPTSSTSQHGSQSHDLKEVAHASTIELDGNLDVRENPMKDFEAEENLFIEPTATAAVSPDELISTSEATDNSVEVISETPVIDTSEVVNDRENVASTIEDEVAVSDTKSDNGSISKTVNDTKGKDLQLPVPEETDLQSTEVASDRDELVSKALYLESGLASLQSPFKELAGRQDAYFISHHNWLGVADGISPWSFDGINKGIYAQELMSNCKKIISDETSETTDPVHVLQRSVNETKSSGSSTALIAHLENIELQIANIGDSGFMVIRNRTVLQKSSPMFHHFFFPLQITQGDDVIKLAEVYHVNLEEGDVVITATDGLFDNLYEKEIVSIVCRSLEQSLEPQKIAEMVAAKAQEVGESKTEKTPFADAAKKEGYDGYKGGKLDAVTVILSLVKSVSIKTKYASSS